MIALRHGRADHSVHVIGSRILRPHGGKRRDHRHRGHRGDPDCGPSRAFSIDFGIENGDQPPFKLRPPRHRDRRPAEGWRGLGIARDFEQVSGIIRGAGARIQHQIVGSALALFEEFTPGQPRERIPPVQRERRPCEQMRGDIAAAHVRELMQQHDAAPLFGPIHGVGGHENRRPKDAERHRHAAGARFENFHAIPNAEHSRKLRGHFAIPKQRCPAARAPDRATAGDQSEQRDRRPRGPQQHHPGPPIEARPQRLACGGNRGASAPQQLRRSIPCGRRRGGFKHRRRGGEQRPARNPQARE